MSRKLILHSTARKARQRGRIEITRNQAIVEHNTAANNFSHLIIMCYIGTHNLPSIVMIFL